jgi:hypothetical protein
LGEFIKMRRSLLSEVGIESETIFCHAADLGAVRVDLERSGGALLL